MNMPQEIVDYPVGFQVAYLPHARFLPLSIILTDANTKYGFVSGGNRAEGFLVRFWNPDPQATERLLPEEKKCMWDDLCIYRVVPQEQVRRALKRLKNPQVD